MEPATVREEIEPRWPLRLALRGGPDGVMRRRGAVVERIVHVAGEPVLVRLAQPSPRRVVIGAWAGDPLRAGHALERMRFAIGADEDLRPFHRAFRGDPLIGRSLRARPWLRASRRPDPFEALAWSICEQLIEFVRATAIERRIVHRLGRRCSRTGLRDLPTPQRLAGTAPALLESFGLGHRRALTLIRAAREIERGRLDLHAPDQDATIRRLLAVRGIGTWTTAMVCLGGLGRYDRAPSGDVNLLKVVGRLLAGGDPDGFAQEADVDALLDPYGEWRGLAALHLMSAPALARPDDRRAAYGERLAAA